MEQGGGDEVRRGVEDGRVSDGERGEGGVVGGMGGSNQWWRSCSS